jgi:hypothetical protein
MWVAIFRIWADEPIYHDKGRGWRTACGRKIGTHTPLLPRKHVVKFARRCKDCAAQEAT